MSFTQKIALLGILVASSTSTNYQPDSLSSTNNALDVTLNIAMVTSLNGTRVAPGYNGSPTGPTLRVKPGDLLTVTLVNNLEPGSELDTELYEYTQDSSVDAMNRTIVSLIFNLISRPVTISASYSLRIHVRLFSQLII